jgi:type II secretory pathway pseudopilin PulG
MNAKAITATALAVLISILTALLFYGISASISGAATAKNVNCGQSIASAINNDSKSTATRFVLEAGCVHNASAMLIPSEGDIVACAASPTFTARGPAQDPNPKCHVHSSQAEAVFRPIGKGGGEATVRIEGIEITGGNYTSRTGSGTGLAMGQAADDSLLYGVWIHDNPVAGILSGRGTFDSIELDHNTTASGALGVNAAGAKFRHEVEVKNSYIHDTPGNGLWADNEVNDAPTANGKFWIHDNLVVGVGRGGIRWEEVSLGEALIEDNFVHGNSRLETRGGVSIRDAKDAIVKNNVFGPGFGYGNNGNKIAIRADSSGKSGRPPLKNILITGNDLNGETIRSCGGPVSCSSNTP